MSCGGANWKWATDPRVRISHLGKTSGAWCAGRSLANPNTQLLELNPAYSAFATLAYNGTALPDVFSPANGGYFVNSSTTVYGYQRLFANATTLTVQVQPHIMHVFNAKVYQAASDR